MRKVAVDEVDNERSPLGVHSVRRPVSDALGTDHFAMNYFELEPGESFSGGLHTHHDQEELFYVQSGEATFDVADEPDSSATESVSVDAGEVVRFPPGQFQEGYNDADNDETVVGFAFGAPSSKHDWESIESVLHCSECGEETGHGLALTDENRFEFTCGECGNVVSF
ncbi:cupin domain-containing protein [Natronomonas marina]|jgi:mannose-6-phosphate isomerase-like protein (cupin superfamily)|uniref:cupin domain-containing protein n=1 Tax=Natronomonas marina TaxID=2961939 RepID=UPI0020C983B6|nr:cupin domain-containing protein [Natronomonas marina]